MAKKCITGKKLAIFIAVVLLVLAGGCVTDTASSKAVGLPSATPTAAAIITAQPVTPAEPQPGSTQDTVTGCNPDLRVPEPVDTSVPVRDPMPGIRYSLDESESGRTVVLEQGEIVEINLRWAPSVAWNWDVPVSGCAIELLNDGYYDTGTDYCNQSGHYRARYRAKSPGRSFIDGVFGVAPGGSAHAWNPRFNLTVIVK